MEEIRRIGMDTSKHVFELHGVNGAEEPVLHKRLRRQQMVSFFERLEPTEIGIEACAGSHHWARLLGSLGHRVKMMPAQYVKPYVKRGKNDAADAEAACEAMSRPTMRFVPAKNVEQQAELMLMGVRDRLIASRTQLVNAIRGHATEFGLTAAKGLAHVPPLLARIAADETLPALARELFALQAEELTRLDQEITTIEARHREMHRADECRRRLAEIPGIGPVAASLLRLKTPSPELFSSGRDFAAWIGLTPKDHSTGGKTRLGVITKAGDEALRAALVAGATALVQHATAGRGKSASPWLKALVHRKPPKLAAIALANKNARLAWKLMVTGERYRPAQPTPLPRPHDKLSQLGEPLSRQPDCDEAANCKMMRRWCDRPIRNARHSACFSGRHWPRCCLELASRMPSWPAAMRGCINRPHI